MTEGEVLIFVSEKFWYRRQNRYSTNQIIWVHGLETMRAHTAKHTYEIRLQLNLALSSTISRQYLSIFALALFFLCPVLVPPSFSPYPQKIICQIAAMVSAPWNGIECDIFKLMVKYSKLAVARVKPRITSKTSTFKFLWATCKDCNISKIFPWQEQVCFSKYFCSCSKGIPLAQKVLFLAKRVCSWQRNLALAKEVLLLLKRSCSCPIGLALGKDILLFQEQYL